jgi:hypothetical protein
MGRLGFCPLPLSRSGESAKSAKLIREFPDALSRRQLPIILGAFLGGLVAFVIVMILLGRLWRGRSPGQTTDAGEYIIISPHTAFPNSQPHTRLQGARSRRLGSNSATPYALPEDWGNQTSPGFVPPSTVAYLDKGAELPYIPHPAYHSGRVALGQGTSNPRS